MDGTTVESTPSLRRLRLIAATGACAATLALASAWAPWFNSSTARGVKNTTAASTKCGKQGGMTIVDNSGATHCVVSDVSISGRALAASIEDVRASGITRNIAYSKQPKAIMTLPAPSFWALLAGILVLIACALQSMVAAFAAPLCALSAWRALNDFTQYATDVKHGGTLVSVEYGVSLTRLSIVVVSVMSVSCVTLIVKMRKSVWAARKEQGQPASALTSVLQATVSRAVSEAQKQRPGTSS